MESKVDTIAHLRNRIAAIPGRPNDPRLRPSSTARGPHTETARPPALGTARGVLPVPEPLAPLLPHGGLLRGSTVHVTGATALRLGLLASVTGSGGWAGVIGSPNLGLLAGVEMGADLARCALVPDPGADPLAVAAVLLDGLDLVVLSLGGASIPPSRARAIAARTRNNGAVLVVADGSWPTVDLNLDAQVVGYRGLGGGDGGRITGLDLTVEARARGRLPQRGNITLAGHSDGLRWISRPAAPEMLKVAQ